MTASPAGTPPLRYFIHDDFDAFRMEVSGGFVGSAARRAYEAWRAARLLARRVRPIVDISYVTKADEYGRAVLQAWREQDVQIVAASPASSALANSIPRTRVHPLSTHRTLVDRLSSLFRRSTAGNLANAEGPGLSSAASKLRSIENTSLPSHGDMERQVP